MQKFVEPTTIGLSESAHIKLQKLKELGYFREMVDAYRFAVAFALSKGEISGKTKTKTIFNVGTFDPDGLVYMSVSALREEKDEPVYRTVERLAEWGVTELYRHAEKEELSIEGLLVDAEEKLKRIRR